MKVTARKALAFRYFVQYLERFKKILQQPSIKHASVIIENVSKSDAIQPQ